MEGEKHLPKQRKQKAPAVFADSGHLGDRKLDGRGVVDKAAEENQAMTDKFRIAGQEELEDQERSAGPRMEPSEFIRRVKKENSQIIVRDGGVPGAVQLKVYVEPHLREEGNENEPFKYVAGFQWEPLPEFAHIITDSRGLPKKEYRGWRSVLISLIKSRALTYQQAVTQFGEPRGQRAERWFSELRGYR